MKFLKGLRFRLEFVVLWLAMILARALPIQAASWLSGKLWRFIAPRHKSRFDESRNIEIQLLRRTSDHLPHQRGREFPAHDGADLRGSFGRAQ